MSLSGDIPVPPCCRTRFARLAALAANEVGLAILAQLRRFEHFGGPKYLRSLEPTLEGRHYSGIGGTGSAVILGDG